MIIPQIRARVKAELGTKVRLVEGAASLAMLKGRPPALPAIYVMAATEAASENPFGMGGFRQRVDMDVVVVIVTENVSDTRGEATSDAIDILKADVRRALLGWMPDGAVEEVALVAGEVVAARDGVIWWQDTYATAYHLEGAP